MNLQYPYDIFFECIKCGSCCRDPGRRRRKIVLTSADLKSIEAATQVSTNEFCRASHTASEPFRHIMRESCGACPFLDENSMCRIYESRPVICRCYPFSIEFDKDNMVFSVSSKDCAGLGRGIKLTRGFFENLMREIISNFKASEENGQKSRNH
jgi:Fe-S-cluster containining protein